MAKSRLLIALCWALSVAGCRGCLDGGLRVQGPPGYMRCLAADPPEAGTRSVGAVKLHIEGRRLRIEGIEPPLRVAAFAGPAFGPPPDVDTLKVLAELKPHLQVVIGGVGDTPRQAAKLLGALSTLPAPTLLLSGGRDSTERIQSARASLGEAAARIVDVSALRRVDVAGHVFVPVAGASGGHYAHSDDACGHGLDDLKQLASDLGEAEGESRWLLSWQAPGQGGSQAVARTEDGQDLGSADLAELARRIGAPGGLFAWPEVRVLRPAVGDGEREVRDDSAARDLRLVVPRLGGVAVGRSDGTRAMPGFVLLELAEGAMRVLGVHEEV
ncbi:MAG: hypothetical protein OEZ06_16970 [Myxococcales bacterium]|nr:hypothetical protein [Myxococcales bacterium]